MLTVVNEGTSPPSIVVIAGPNGAGKSTIAPLFLRDLLGVREFVNADAIARGLSGFDADAAAIAAGRVMLARLRELQQRHSSFAFETTLASRSFAPRLANARRLGYRIHVVFLWLPSEEIAITRVRERVRQGGHDIPEDVVRRRYQRGLRNFFLLYMPLADRWTVYDNSAVEGPRQIATGGTRLQERCDDEDTWKAIRSQAHVD